MRKLLGAALALVLAAAGIGTSGQPATAAGTVIDSSVARLTIWHSYLAGSREEWAFNTVLASVRPKFPNVRFTVVRQQFGEIFTRFEADPMHGPDLFIAPNDRIGTEVHAGLLRDVTTAMRSRVATLTAPAGAGAVSATRTKACARSGR